MNQINIKPLSVNEGYTGKRYKTPHHRVWKNSVMWLLPKTLYIPKNEKLEVHYQFGLSSNASDFDNYIKFFQDCLQVKYKFNDKAIFKAVVEKKLVSKGSEYIRFKIMAYMG